jgi:hypothetical protein
MTCPSCRKRGLDLRIRCDLDSTECLYLAICEDCADEYWIDRDSAPTEIGDDQICGVCGSAHCILTLSCDAVTHRCTYGASQTPCPH